MERQTGWGTERALPSMFEKRPPTTPFFSCSTSAAILALQFNMEYSKHFIAVAIECFFVIVLDDFGAFCNVAVSLCAKDPIDCFCTGCCVIHNDPVSVFSCIFKHIGILGNRIANGNVSG